MNEIDEEIDIEINFYYRLEIFYIYIEIILHSFFSLMYFTE